MNGKGMKAGNNLRSKRNEKVGLNASGSGYSGCLRHFGLTIMLAAGQLILGRCTMPSHLLVNDLSNYLQHQPSKPPLISAHRGGGTYAGYPENCLESFGYLARQMPVIIECDISQTKDSVLIMMHDDTFERTTTGIGKVNQQPWTYASTLFLEDHRGINTNYRIPTLDEVLKWGDGKVIYTLYNHFAGFRQK